MHGKIISFNEYENNGVIIADDGIQYVFDGNDWKEQYAPKAGDNVDFMFDGMGSINRISYQSTQSSTPIPPSLDKTLQDRDISATQEFGAYNHFSSNQYSESIENLYITESDYGIIDWTKKVFNNYATFVGRARRKEYWLFYLATIIMGFAVGFIEGFIGGLLGIELLGDVSVLSILLTLILLVPTLAVATRRLHDTGRSGWWQLLWCIPIIGWIALVILLAQQTSPQVNQWGPPAKRI